MLKNILNLFWMSDEDAVRNIVVCILQHSPNMKSAAVDAFFGSSEVRRKVNAELAEFGISVEVTQRGLLIRRRK